MKITDYLKMESLYLFENIKNSEELYEKIVPEILTGEKRSKPEKKDVIKLIQEREKDGTFVIKEGYAIPHIRVAGLKEPILKLCVVKRGIKFNSEKTANIVFL